MPRGQTPFEKEEKEGEDVVAKRERESRKGGQKRRCTKKKGNKREQEGPRRHRARLAIARASPRRSACTTVPIWFKEEREKQEWFEGGGSETLREIKTCSRTTPYLPAPLCANNSFIKINCWGVVVV